MKKLLLLFLILGCVISLQAQFPKSVALTAAGTLSSILTVDELNTVTDLTLTGSIDARDFRTMRDLMPLLADIDLSGASVVAYSGTEGTSVLGNENYSANAVPEFAFNKNYYNGKTTLLSVKLPLNSLFVGDYSFLQCNNLAFVSLPSGLTGIGNYSFGACWKLTSIQLPGSMVTIGSHAFESTALTSILIPASVTTIAPGAFTHCDNLPAIDVDPASLNFKSIGGVLFNFSGEILVQYPSANTATSYIIPSTVTTIYNSAFWDCQNLLSLTIPNSITTLMSNAFLGCAGLTTIELPSSIAFVGSGAFEFCRNLSSVKVNWPDPLNLSNSPNVFFINNSLTRTLTVPYGTKALYAEADQWKDFTNIIEMAEIKRTHVPDNNFEQTLIDLGYDTGPLDDYVLTANIATVTSLDVSGKGIANLTGIQDFVALQQLYSNNNLIASLDLSKNSELNTLDFGNNKLTSLDLSKNPLLTILNCTYNQISNIDLANNVNLEQIAVGGNPISSLDISRNLKLKWFYVYSTRLERIDCSNHKILESIDCSRNSLLSSLNLKNGNNSILKNLFAIENPILSCIQVDDPSLASTYPDWTIDKQAGYSNNCAVPVANAGVDQTVAPGNLVILDGSLSYDSYGDPLTYTWNIPAGIIFNLGNPAKPSFTAPNVSRERNYAFTLIVNDGSVNSVADAITVTVKPGNSAPIVICNDLTVKLDASGNYALSLDDLKSLAAGTKDDKDSFKNLKIVAEPNTFSCQDLGNPVSVKITVSDSEGASSSCSSLVTVKDVTPPMFSSVPKNYNVVILPGEIYTLPDFSELYPAKDVCSNVTYIQTPASGSIYTNSAKEIVTLKALDGYGNMAQVNISLTLTVRTKLKSADVNVLNEICDSPQLDVFPNPFKERVNFILTCPNDANVVLETFSGNGSKLKTLFSGKLKANQKNIFEYVSGDMPSQVIYYRLLIDDKIKTGKLILDK